MVKVKVVSRAQASQEAISEFFWGKVNRNGPVPANRPDLGACWLWTGDKAHGYGRFRLPGPGNNRVPAHRWAYEQEHGPVDRALQIDHLCRNTACVRASHLAAVTPRVNLERSTAISTINRAKTHCPAGHPYDDANTFVTGSGSRQCVVCNLARANARNARLREQRKAQGTYVPPRAERTHCPRGHEYTPENTYLQVAADGREHRSCLACRRERDDARHARERSGVGIGGHERAKTHCPRGHEYTPANTYVNPKGARVCRACARAASQARHQQREVGPAPPG